MWNSISKVKNKYKGRQGILVGPGPTADGLDALVAKMGNPVLIGVNRSVMLRNDFEFTFVDHSKTLSEIEPYAMNTRYICIPVFSRGEVNINFKNVQLYVSKILLYAWVYEVDEFLNAPEYALNDELLYISWGNVQSAIQFARRIGLQSLTVIGCDGGEVNGKLYATIIEKAFGSKLSKANREKRGSDHAKTKAKIEMIAKRVGIDLQI